MLLKLIASILAIVSAIGSSTISEKALATVTNVNNGIVTIVYNGNYYEFYGEGYCINDKIIVTFDNGKIIDAEWLGGWTNEGLHSGTRQF